MRRRVVLAVWLMVIVMLVCAFAVAPAFSLWALLVLATAGFTAQVMP